MFHLLCILFCVAFCQSNSKKHTLQRAQPHFHDIWGFQLVFASWTVNSLIFKLLGGRWGLAGLGKSEDKKATCHPINKTKNVFHSLPPWLLLPCREQQIAWNKRYQIYICTHMHTSTCVHSLRMKNYLGYIHQEFSTQPHLEGPRSPFHTAFSMAVYVLGVQSSPSSRSVGWDNRALPSWQRLCEIKMMLMLLMLSWLLGTKLYAKHFTDINIFIPTTIVEIGC